MPLRREKFKGQEIVTNRWQELLKDTDFVPIDVYTPLWLWSRGKFRVEF